MAVSDSLRSALIPPARRRSEVQEGVSAMKRHTAVGLALMLTLTLAALAPIRIGAAAQNTGKISGEVLDRNEKPFPGVIVIISNEQGQKHELKTDEKGRFSQGFLRTGMVYVITFKINDQTFHEQQRRLEGGKEEIVNVNVKQLLAKTDAASLEAAKKEEEVRKQFEGMKEHFDAGRDALDAAKQAKLDLQKAPPDQKAALQEKMAQSGATAVTELQAAEKAAPENDPNLHVVLAKLGDAYETAGNYAEAVTAYQKAIALKPENAGYYNNFGNNLARAGKTQEAMAAYEKSATLDPVNAASAWRNAGIVLFNANLMKEAIQPLKKSIEIDPKSPQAWYLLGASLVNTMGFKQEGGKIIPILEPGTVEAYEKCIELDSNGPYGAQARDGLEQLKAMGLGIETRIRTRPPKKQ